MDDKDLKRRFSTVLMLPVSERRVELPIVPGPEDEVIVLCKRLGTVTLEKVESVGDKSVATIKNRTAGIEIAVVIVAPPGFQKLKQLPWFDILKGAQGVTNWLRNKMGKR